MKNINYAITLTFLILLIGSYSCSEDFLDQKPTSSLTELTYYKNVDELETGLVACYAAIGAFSGFDTFHWQHGNIGSDDSDKGSQDTDVAPLTEISFSRQTAATGPVAGPWNVCYTIISRCNEVIDRSSGTLGDAGKIEKIVDQAKFLRALSYYHLVTLYGDVPLVNRFLGPYELNMGRTQAIKIWEQIESDLKDATNLPTVSEWNQSGRITSGAAYSLLGKVYLTQNKYSQAISAFHKVVASGQYNLIPDFGFIFRHDGENCTESIFEIQRKNNISGGALGTYCGVMRISRDQAAGGWGFDCPTADLKNEFEPGDPRMIYTFIFRGDKFPGSQTGSTYTAANSFSPSGYSCRKAWVPWSERTGLKYYEVDINYRYMRYAEILLLYAESLNEINRPDSALILVNMVRARARNTPAIDPQRISCTCDLSHSGELLPDVTTSDQTKLRNAIWHEQRVELAMEGHRRNSLLRTGRLKERMEAAKGSRGCTVEPHELLYPIYQDEIELSNHMLTQTPGY